VRVWRFFDQRVSAREAKIDNSADSDTAKRERIDAGITDFLWGVELDADLHTLAKINLVMHGDGYSHIVCGDGLSTEELEEGSFDVAVMNPPFTTACGNRAVLDNFELGQGCETQELDILFVERAVRALKPGGRLFIVLPEGMLNLASYADFRGWLAQHCELTHTTSLPEGAFQPFGNSASKTCILGVRRKPERPKRTSSVVFAARAQAIGYEPGKKDYRRTDGNDLVRFVDVHDGLEEYAGDPRKEFEAVKVSGANVASSRFDAGAYLNAFEKENLSVFQAREFVDFAEVARVRQTKRVENREVFYFQADWVAAETGVIQHTARVVRQGRHNQLRSGDIFLVSINPKLNRVVLVPDGIPEIWTTNEGFTIELIERCPFVHIGYLVAALRAPYVVRQMVRLATGSSSSRAVERGGFVDVKASFGRRSRATATRRCHIGRREFKLAGQPADPRVAQRGRGYCRIRIETSAARFEKWSILNGLTLAVHPRFGAHQWGTEGNHGNSKE
jgi:type I restriction enzyme M protein